MWWALQINLNGKFFISLMWLHLGGRGETLLTISILQIVLYIKIGFRTCLRLSSTTWKMTKDLEICFTMIVTSTMLYDEKCWQCLHDASSVGCKVFHSKLSAFLHMNNNIVQLNRKQRLIIWTRMWPLIGQCNKSLLDTSLRRFLHKLYFDLVPKGKDCETFWMH